MEMPIWLSELLKWKEKQERTAYNNFIVVIVIKVIVVKSDKR